MAIPEFTKVEKGELVLDVRTAAEFAQEHFKGSINIPLQDLPSRFEELQSNWKLLVCCAAGVRSEAAVGFLKTKGFINLLNVGSWTQLRS